MSTEILCMEECPWGGSQMCVHTCHRALLTHTHLVQLRLSRFLKFKANIYILRLLCIYTGLPLHCQYLGSCSWSVPVDFYWKVPSEAVNIFVHVIIHLVRAERSPRSRSCDLGGTEPGVSLLSAASSHSL